MVSHNFFWNLTYSSCHRSGPSLALPCHGSATPSLGGHHGVESRAARSGPAPSSGRPVTPPYPASPLAPAKVSGGRTPPGGCLVSRGRCNPPQPPFGHLRLWWLGPSSHRRRPPPAPPVDGHGVRGEWQRSPRRLALGGGMGSDCLFS